MSYRLMQLSFAFILCVMFTPTESFAQESEFRWQQFPPIPDKQGFAGMFAGISKDVLIAAGGANFPNTPPWEGGQKVWYDSIYVLTEPNGRWQLSKQKLPRPLGYGVSISYGDALIIIGGESATADTPPHGRDEVFALRWNGKSLDREDLPSLPQTAMNLSGALLGSTVYVAGGIPTSSATTALHTFWSLDLALPRDQRRWIEHKPWPGAERMLAVAAVADNQFFLLSGTQLSAGDEGKAVRKYLTDGFSFEPKNGWRRIADLPRATVAAPSPAFATGGSVFVFSGDDGLQIGKPPEKHRGFTKEILAYDLATDRWSSRGKVPVANVVLPTVTWRKFWLAVSGESRPGVRSPVIWGLRHGGE